MIHASEGSENGSPGIVWEAEPKYEIAFKKSLKVCRLWPDKARISSVCGTVPLRLGFPKWIPWWQSVEFRRKRGAGAPPIAGGVKGVSPVRLETGGPNLKTVFRNSRIFSKYSGFCVEGPQVFVRQISFKAGYFEHLRCYRHQKRDSGPFQSA
ncbi:hypothetical protein TNIN_176381 [Trichonephila inaurata madagascariensis]|uniref:Uncharacterized protein n=1 Tax=Trichonephila inaurata madagascariensis TaxID=2747483 RepID=A0A8X7BUZ2_9ARAC|nr:hypothetical protein TNIN_176381 [Trichonephila inaurata madagascariensis]